MQRDSATCGRQAAENAVCVHIFCNGEQEGRAVTKKRPNRRKSRKKMLSELRPELSVTKGIIKSIFHLHSTFLYYILSLYLFRAMLDCPGGSLFKGFGIYSFYGIWPFGRKSPFQCRQWNRRDDGNVWEKTLHSGWFDMQKLSRD